VRRSGERRDRSLSGEAEQAAGRCFWSELPVGDELKRLVDAIEVDLHRACIRLGIARTAKACIVERPESVRSLAIAKVFPVGPSYLSNPPAVYADNSEGSECFAHRHPAGDGRLV